MRVRSQQLQIKLSEINQHHKYVQVHHRYAYICVWPYLFHLTTLNDSSEKPLNVIMSLISEPTAPRTATVTIYLIYLSNLIKGLKQNVT